MSDVPHVAITQSPAHLRNRLTTCIKGIASVRFSSVMLVRSEMTVLIFFVTCGRTKHENRSAIFSFLSSLTAPNSMISLINPWSLRLYAPFHSKSKTTIFIWSVLS